MPNLQASPIVLGQDAFTSSATQLFKLGTKARTRDGREFKYCLAGAADLVAGNVIQSPAPIANHLNQTLAVAAAAGATQVTVPVGATAGAANLYAEGWLMIAVTPGNGFMYNISAHPAFAGSDSQIVTLLPDDAIQVALTTSTHLSLIQNPYKNVIQCPTTKTGCVVGVASYVIKATQFGWLQTFGPAAVLINGTPAVSAPVVNSATTAGAVDVWTAAAQPTASYVGEMMQVGVSTQNNAVFLNIA